MGAQENVVSLRVFFCQNSWVPTKSVGVEEGWIMQRNGGTRGTPALRAACALAALVLWACKGADAVGPGSEAQGVRRAQEARTSTPEEAGIEALGLWDEGVGAYRGWVPLDGHHRFWTGDNALMLWAFSKGTYDWARKQGRGRDVRDYLVDSALGEGLFSEGKKKALAGGAVSDTPPECSPAMETQVLHGILVYTLAYPNQSGRRSAARYFGFLEKTLEAQHRRVKAREQGRKCTGGPGINHDFSSPATVAFHLWNTALWARHTGRKDDEARVNEAWDVLASTRQEDGTFSRAVLREAQILLALREVIATGLAPRSVEAVARELASRARNAGSGKLSFGRDDKATDDTQALAYHMLSTDSRPFSAKAFFANRLCVGKGYAWKGKGSLPNAGPVEDQALGLLGAWHASKHAWGDDGAPCRVSPRGSVQTLPRL